MNLVTVTEAEAQLIIKAVGLKAQLLKTIEEAGELIQILAKELNDIESVFTTQDIICELIDLDVMIQQLAHYYSVNFPIVTSEAKRIKKIQLLTNLAMFNQMCQDRAGGRYKTTARDMAESHEKAWRMAKKRRARAHAQEE